MTGVVSLLRTLDRESVSVHQLNITASDSQQPPAVTSLHVDVIDVNDNAPVFVQRTYHAVVDEEQQPPVAVVTVSATDFDDPHSKGFSLSPLSHAYGRLPGADFRIILKIKCNVFFVW